MCTEVSTFSAASKSPFGHERVTTGGGALVLAQNTEDVIQVPRHTTGRRIAPPPFPRPLLIDHAAGFTGWLSGPQVTVPSFWRTPSRTWSGSGA